MSDSYEPDKSRVNPVETGGKDEETRMDGIKSKQEPNGIVMERAEEHDSDSDDFGSFSDASVEQEDLVQDQKNNLDNVGKYLDQVLPMDGCLPRESLREDEEDLNKLIQDERPKVIYEQLVLLRTVLRPFIWDKSRIKSNLWHILRIPERTKPVQQEVGREPLNDSLFIALCKMLNDKTIPSQTVLRDQMGIAYSPPLTPVFLQEEYEKEKEKEIPGLLAIQPDEVVDLREYHDKVCQSIDLLLERLQELHIKQADLVKDKTTFENVVTNLTGHTQRLYRDEVALYNKHKNKRKNRFSWVGH